MNQMIGFYLALNAGPEDVINVIDSIREFFGVNVEGSVAPGDVIIGISGSTAPAGVVTNVAADDGEPRDKNGFKWDERIHSTSKAMNQDGTWRYRKGVDEATKKRVEAALRSTAAAPAAVTTTPAATASMPALPGANVLPGLPGLPQVNTENQAYTNFVKFIAEHTSSPQNPTGRLTADWVTAVLAQYGVAEGSMQNLAHRPDLIPNIETAIKGALGIA